MIIVADLKTVRAPAAGSPNKSMKYSSEVTATRE